LDSPTFDVVDGGLLAAARAGLHLFMLATHNANPK